MSGVCSLESEYSTYAFQASTYRKETSFVLVVNLGKKRVIQLIEHQLTSLLITKESIHKKTNFFEIVLRNSTSFLKKRKKIQSRMNV